MYCGKGVEENQTDLAFATSLLTAQPIRCWPLRGSTGQGPPSGLTRFPKNVVGFRTGALAPSGTLLGTSGLEQAKDVAEEVQQLPVKIEKSNKIYVERKKQYQTLFKKATRSSSGPWQFHGKSLYYFSKGEKNWYEAEDFCISRGAHLASILDQEEQNFISSQLQHTSWIGLTTEYEDGTWKWSDGSRLVQEYWYEQPSISRVFRKSNQDCAMMVPSLPYRNWKDTNCHKLYRWVCKENLDLVEQ